MGNANLGDSNRGLTQIAVDSIKVYNGLCGGSLSAVVRGFSAAIAFGDGLIDAEVQDYTGGPTGIVATAADNAFDAGALTIAVAGNFGDDGAGTVTAPGNARKALAVGAIDVVSQALESYSGLGPTSDGRTKPDILGPTNVIAADNGSDTTLQVFTGTSASTPNAAGFIANLWSTYGEPAPGYMYAASIALGNNAFGAAYDNELGAGLVQWGYPTDGSHIWASSVTVSTSAIDVPIDVPFAPYVIDAAIWWPETVGSGHHDVDLYLIDPNGQIVASGTSSASVFEKAQTTEALAGTWTLRVYPYAVSGSQVVYWGWCDKY
jgi:hypothetical protein